MIGERIGHFEIVARAGRGAMGEVFIAEHVAIRTRVAIKVLHPEISANTAHIQRFFNEARAVARIQHAGIVKIFDVGSHPNGRAYLIMECLEGETLKDRLRRRGRMGLQGAAEIARQVASILDATHHADIIHRDLKPENVFLVRDRELARGERVKLLDFGIAKLSDTLAGSGPSTVGAIGTPTYMAPEQWKDSSTVDWRVDAYSLGCVIYEMVTGVPPFRSKSVAEACAKHLNEIPSSTRTHRASVPAALDAFTLRLLSKDPALRAQSTEEIERQLAAFIADLPPDGDESEATLDHALEPTLPAVTTLSTAAAIPTNSPASHRTTAVIVGAGMIAFGALVVWWYSGELQPSPRSPIGVTAPPPLGGNAETRQPGPALAVWLAAENPFVAWRGARWLAHQVTRAEYRRFLESLPVYDALRLQPVTGWNDGELARPVAWVTFERATEFCKTVHASLPTSEQWRAAANGAWGLDPAGSGQPGPLQEWTATVRDGLVVVCGGSEAMSPTERAAAASDTLMKSSEAQAGSNVAPSVVASETIGFRCVR